MVPLPKATPKGYRVTVHRFVTSDVSKFEPLDVYRAIFMIGDIRLREEPPIVGDVFIFDMKHMTAAHLAKMATPLLRRAINCTHVCEKIYKILLKLNVSFRWDYDELILNFICRMLILKD